MKKLLQKLSFVALLPVVWLPQVLSSRVLAQDLLAVTSASGTAVDSSVRKAAQGCQPSPTGREEEPDANDAAQAQLSLVEQFAPPSPSALKAAGCPETLNVVSRALLLATLARIETLEDAETQLAMLLEVAGLYRTLEMPQALPLLDYLLAQSQTLEQGSSRLRFAVALTHRYGSFRSDGKTPLPQEAEAMAAAMAQIVQLNFGEGEGPSPAEGADVFAVAQWFSTQNDLETARQAISHIDEPLERDLFQQQLEEAYANALEQAGKKAAAERHRRETLSAETLAVYTEAKAHERMAALAEALPAEGEAIDDRQLKTLKKNVEKLTVPWAKYTYGQMVARQLIIQGRHDAALETLARAPVPTSDYDEVYSGSMADVETAEAAEALSESPDPTTLPIELGFEAGQLIPAILATEVAADGYVNEALAFIDHLPPQDSTRLFQRALLLSGISVFRQGPGEGGAGLDAGGEDRYLEEAIALAQNLPQRPANASLWVLISLAQRWHGEDRAADQAMEQAIAIAPALESVHEALLAELKKDPWIIDEEVVAASEAYGSIRDFYEALHEQDLEAAEAALAKTEDITVVVSMKGSLAAAYSKTEQVDKATQLLEELFDLRRSEALLESFGSEDDLLHSMVSAFASGNGYITALESALAGLDVEPALRENLLIQALEVYSYRQVHEAIAVEELMARRDALLSLGEAAPIREQMLRSLTTSLANHGHFAEAIAFLPEFDLRDQIYGLVSLTAIYIGAEAPLDSAQSDSKMLQQLQLQIQNLAIPAEAETGKETSAGTADPEP